VVQGVLVTIRFTRQPDGSYAGPDGWRIVRRHSSGTGQSRPFARVNVKAYSYWAVLDPQGVTRATGDLLVHAKANAVRQVELARERASGL
jgi:hypothetical protein